MASEVVTALGGDITLSVSFAVANELLEGYRESQSLPLGLVVSLLAVSTIADWAAQLCERYSAQTHGLLSFAATILGTARRITLSTLVQVLAGMAVSGAPMRMVRVISLCGVAVFFLFLQQTARSGMLVKQRRS